MQVTSGLCDIFKSNNKNKDAYCWLCNFIKNSSSTLFKLMIWGRSAVYVYQTFAWDINQNQYVGQKMLTLQTAV